MSKTITLLSLGAGVQSTALALMAERGLIEKPVAAIFADTGDEPASVYAHLERLRGMLSFPVHIVKAGNGLGADFLAALRGETNRASQPPFHVKALDLSTEEIQKILSEREPRYSDWASARFSGVCSDEDAEREYRVEWWNWNERRRRVLTKDRGGMLWRACTRDYKIYPIRRKTRELMADHAAKSARMQIGISTDERERENASGVKYITNVHPLLELGWSRRDCESWLTTEYGIKPLKSACIYCPYRSNAGWQQMKQDDPEAFEQACQFDDALRIRVADKARGARIVGDLYVWRGFEPLRTANFESNPGQMDFGFEQECDGMCGH